MLKRFGEINKGQELSVGHSIYKKNLKPLQNSPVFDQHSMRNVIRKKEIECIERDNLMLMGSILSPNYTVNRSQLEKQWQDTFKYKHLVSKSKYFNFDKLVNQEMQHKNSQTSLGNLSKTFSARQPKQASQSTFNYFTTSPTKDNNQFQLSNQPSLRPEVMFTLMQNHMNENAIKKTFS